MTIINIRSVDGFTVTDNFYSLPEGMSADTGLRMCEQIASRWTDAGESISWLHFDDALAKWGIIPVEIPHVDVEF